MPRTSSLPNRLVLDGSLESAELSAQVERRDIHREYAEEFDGDDFQGNVLPILPERS